MLPIPVDTSAHDGGVYVQPVRVAGAVRGEWTTVSYRVHVFTEVDGVGEVMTAEDGDGNSYSDEVNGTFQPGTRDVVGGRAVFVVPPGTDLTTTNTSPAVTANCPAA